MSPGDDNITKVSRGTLFPERLGPCHLLRLLGTGGMGSVYLGELLEGRHYGPKGSHVAVKVLRPDLGENAARIGNLTITPELLAAFASVKG